MTKLVAIVPLFSLQLNRIVMPGEEFDIEISQLDLDQLVAQKAIEVKEVKHGKSSSDSTSNDSGGPKPDVLVSG